MEFRKIMYVKNKEVNLKGCFMSDDVRKVFKNNDPETPLVLRILIDNDNNIVIEYANTLGIDAIRKATEVRTTHKTNKTGYIDTVNDTVDLDSKNHSQQDKNTGLSETTGYSDGINLNREQKSSTGSADTLRGSNPENFDEGDTICASDVYGSQSTEEDSQ